MIYFICIAAGFSAGFIASNFSVKREIANLKKAINQLTSITLRHETKIIEHEDQINLLKFKQ